MTSPRKTCHVPSASFGEYAENATRTAFATMRLANAGDDEFSAYLAGLSSQLGLMALLRVSF